jgi:serine-type D-Ala-D-Ala carboxypeptidase (penicillin-binding protein 5/6)
VLASMYGGVPKTVRDMQQRAKELNADDTHVVTPDGYDEPGQVSSAYDLSLFARTGLQNADFRQYCSTATAQFPGDYTKAKDGKKKRKTFQIQNTDRLLTGDYDLKPYPGIAGVKNGYTTNAGNTYTGVAQHGNRVLLVTVMNPQKKTNNEIYRESGKLLDWGFKAAGKVTPVGTLVAPGQQGTQSGPGGQDGSDSQSGGTKTTGGGQAQAAVSSNTDTSGLWTALGVTGGLLVVLGAVAFAVRRRWPRPAAGGRHSRD